MASGPEEKNIRYKLLLDKLAEELTRGEVHDLVFLLRFHIEGKRIRLAINGDPRKLLTELQKHNFIGTDNLTLLGDVFELIGRNDFIREIKENVGFSLAGGHLISPFIRTLWTFGQRLDSDDLKKSMFRLDWTKEKEDIQKAWQLFEKAFERGHLQKDNLNKLKEFANTIGQSKTLELVMDPHHFMGGFVPVSSHSGVEDGVMKNIQGYQNANVSHKEQSMHNEVYQSVKKPTQIVSGEHSVYTGANVTLAQKAELAQQIPKSSQMTLAEHAELFKNAKPRQNQVTLAERAAVAKGDGTSQMTLADKAKLAMSEKNKQQDQQVLPLLFAGILGHQQLQKQPQQFQQEHHHHHEQRLQHGCVAQARHEDPVFQYPQQYQEKEHIYSPHNIHVQQQISVLSSDDISVSPSVAQPDPHKPELALPSKIPENHIWSNTSTSLMKPSGDFQREQERSDSQKELSQEILLLESMSNMNLSGSHQNIYDACNDKTIQNVEGNTEQRSITAKSFDEVTLTLRQPVPFETGEFRPTSNIGESTHHVNFTSDQVLIVSASPSDNSSYEGERRDGQDANITGSDSDVTVTNKSGSTNGLQETVDGRGLSKMEVTPLNAMEKIKHNEDETKWGSVGERDILPHQELQKGVLEPSTILTTYKEQKVRIPKTPRCGRIMPMKVEDMKTYIGTEIGKGAFGTVYRGEGDKDKFAVKVINVTDELYQKSYEKEIHNGRILHPFINPIIARAEDLSNPGERVLYIMYPYMENRDIRHNIELEKAGKKLCTTGEESNSRIWTCCIYQIAHAVDYLHNPVTSSFRGSIFHQDLTSRNIFLDGHFNVKIGDFGIAVEAKQNATSVTRTRIQGTHGYHPPNMNSEKYNASYDVFSVGVVMLEILTGEEAMLNGNYLYKKYDYDGGDEDLIDDLDKRAKKNEAARWKNKDHRDNLAKIALEAVNQNEAQRKGVDLLQKLDKMRLNPVERYLWPAKLDRCASCFVNSPAKLPLKGKDCAGSNTKSPCRPFCLHCLMKNHINPLVCPQHGKTRPPFGDHVYGVFVAGNNVDGMVEFSYGGNQHQNTMALAQTFITDAEKVKQVLTAKYPFVLGASAEHLTIVKPKNPGTKEKMETSIKEAFENMNSTIKKALEENGQNPENDILPNSLFIFYFSGHGSKENGLFLGNAKETLKASITGMEEETHKATTKFIMEMLHEKLGVDHVLVILDCCQASSQNFANCHWLNVDTVSVSKRKETSILQLSSCDTSEKSVVKSEGSLFTNFLCLGLQGMDSEELGGDEIICCAECEKHRGNRKEMNIKLPCVKYHINCVSDDCITYTSLRDFIEGHFDLLRADKTSGSGTMIPVSSSQGEKKVYLAYYNPNKSHIPIHLKGSKTNGVYCLRSHPDSMDRLKKDIISYILSGEGDLSCDVLTFHQSYGQESYRLIAIHLKYGKDKDEELTSLDSIENAWSCSHELEARVREDVKGLSHGPVKLSSISKSMVTGYESEPSSNDNILQIKQGCIEIAGKSVLDVKLLKKTMQESLSEHKKLISEKVKKIAREIRKNKSVVEKIEENVLRFCLFDEFSILEVI